MENEQTSSSIPKYENIRVRSGVLPSIMQIFGWVYFAVSLIGGISLIINSTTLKNVPTDGYYSQNIKVVNYAYRTMGIAGVISSILVLLLCLGIARIIEQNIYLIKKQNT